MNKKLYGWDEVKNFLISELKKTKHIMTFGTIGSLNIEHDIDIIVTKKSKSSSANFYREIHKLFEKLNSYLKKKYRRKIIRFSHFISEKEFLKIGGYRKGDLALHVMLYLSWSDMEKNWTLTKNFNVKNFFTQNYNVIYGNKNDLFKKEFQKEGKYEKIFKRLANMDRINANYPEKFLIECMDHFYNYIYKNYGNREKVKSKNKKEVRENFYKVCDFLDELT